MAEYASAIIGLAAAGAKVGGALYTLVDTLKNAPIEFLALSNEVTDFRVMLSRLLEATQSGELAAISSQYSKDLDVVRIRAEEIIQGIETLVTKVKKEKYSEHKRDQVHRGKWLWRVREAKNLQDKLREQKVTICNVIALGIMKSSLHNGLHISRLELKLEAAVQNQTLLMERQEKMLIEFLESNKMPAEGPQLDEKSSITLHLGRTLDDKTTTELLQLQTSAPRRPAPKLRPMTGSEPLQCFEDCQCRCHYRTVLRSPRAIAHCLGDLFLACSNLPWCFSGVAPCTEQTCRRNWQPNADLRYLLPPWLSFVAGNLSLSYNLRRLPINITVQTRQTIPYDSPILVCTQEGDVEGIRKCLLSGEASITDVDPYGLGLLYYASYYCWRASGRDKAVKACQYLLDMGANRDWDDEIGNTAKETMVDNTIMSLAMRHHGSHELEPDDFVDIAQLFEQPTANLIDDLVQDRELPNIHQVLLGIEHDLGTLEQYLASFGQLPLPPEIVDAPDVHGRTALSWAVEYGWSNAVGTLLKYGANPRASRPSLRGNLPLLHLVIATPPPLQGVDWDPIGVVKLLIEAGADVNGLDHEGWTPLHVAASWNNLDIIEELARSAGNGLDWDALTDDNQSAIDLSLNGGSEPAVQAILQTRGEKHRAVELEDFFDALEIQPTHL